MKKVKLSIFRSGKENGGPRLVSYSVPFIQGMRVLDGLKYLQENIDPTLSFRWNCRAGTCGSCTVRINGTPKLSCKEEIDSSAKELVIEPLKTLKVVKDLLVDASAVEKELDELYPWFEAKEDKKEFVELFEEEVADAMEMKKCIHCYACFDVCPIVRSSKNYIGPKAIVNINSFEMHPKNSKERIFELNKKGLWNCIMSGCCSDVCPQEIKISQNAIPFAKEKSISFKGEKK